MNQSKLQLSIVLPVYKNAEVLEELFEKLKQALLKLGVLYEVIFINDSCPENSLSILKGLGDKNPEIIILDLKKNVGQNRAILSGLSQARGEFIVIMDADLQDPPEAIALLFDKIKEGYAVVFAGRRGKYQSNLRLLTSHLFKTFLSLISNLPKDAGIFLIMNRQIQEYLLSFQEPYPYVVGMIACSKLPLISIPITRNKRPRGKSAYSSWKRFKLGFSSSIKVIKWRYFPKLGKSHQNIYQNDIKTHISNSLRPRNIYETR
ncbi:MAG: glycosyltransferase family 2 protein [Acidobacteria bacterium]|nr:glycosyltransferase family 2 protein [Acidobacteriota bacterium]